jgi:glycosyltransferase involved in cell wall biosynthesis
MRRLKMKAALNQDSTGASYTLGERKLTVTVSALPTDLASTQPIATRDGSRIVVAIPAFNEDRFIGSLVLKLRACGKSVLVVDDGSTDATAAVAEAAGAAVVRHDINKGKMSAVQTIFHEARRMNADVLVLLDGDSQHDPSEVDQLAAAILDSGADMVVGSRFAGIRSRIPRWRVVGQHALTFATNIGSGVALTDTESGYRAFSRRAIEQMRFKGSGFALEPATQFQAKQHGWKVLEVPISVHYELPMKRNPVWHGMGQLDAIFRLVAEHRPLLFFGVPGLLLLLLGLLLGVQVTRIYQETLQLAVGYALITVLLAVVGLLTTFTGIVLHAMRLMFLEYTARD